MATYSNENTGPYKYTGATPGNAYAGSAGGGTVISAVNYRNMANILNNLASHNHIFYDDYTTVCDCQCQCNCNRGTV